MPVRGIPLGGHSRQLTSQRHQAHIRTLQRSAVFGTRPACRCRYKHRQRIKAHAVSVVAARDDFKEESRKYRSAQDSLNWTTLLALPEARTDVCAS